MCLRTLGEWFGPTLCCETAIEVWNFWLSISNKWNVLLLSRCLNLSSLCCLHSVKLDYYTSDKVRVLLVSAQGAQSCCRGIVTSCHLTHRPAINSSWFAFVTPQQSRTGGREIRGKSESQKRKKGRGMVDRGCVMEKWRAGDDVQLLNRSKFFSRVGVLI